MASPLIVIPLLDLKLATDDVLLILAVSRSLLHSHLIRVLIVIFHQMMTPPARARAKACSRAWVGVYTQN